ncbi:MAG: hypothetical protein KZQ95_12680 [Candidatus Thiodiazotropha sp. (ex Epidulcina cf. delphinae)]|nr:hypothetical protein [Candidatus Thiodiazotropha sp. (ex Epidulcina cf. delphinae)]
MKSIKASVTTIMLSLLLSACGGESADPESNEVANNSVQDTVVSSGGDTDDAPDQESDTPPPQEENPSNGGQEETVVVPPAPTPPAPTPTQPTNPVETPSTGDDDQQQPPPADDQEPEPAPADDDQATDPEPAPQPVLGAASLTSATIADGNVTLSWVQTNSDPEGGYDIVIDGVDTGPQYRTTATSTTIGGVDVSIGHCFIVEARYTDTSEFLRSNEMCTDAQQPANQAPVISGNPAAAVVVGELYSFTPTASDADNDGLTFSVANLPAWADFNTANGTLSGSPAAQNEGAYNNILITVSDGADSNTLAGFSISVNAAAATTGSMALRWIAPATRTDKSVLNLADIEGYRIYIGTTRDNLQMRYDLQGGGLTSYTVNDYELGDYYVAITAYDYSGNMSGYSNVVQKTVEN